MPANVVSGTRGSSWPAALRTRRGPPRRLEERPGPTDAGIDPPTAEARTGEGSLNPRAPFRILAVGATAVALVLLVAPSGTLGVTVPAAFTVTLGATPTQGPSPLLVELTGTVSSGEPTAANWSFGDGTYLNESGPGGLSLAHIFTSPGLFTVQVRVWEGSASATASTQVVAPANVLGVTIVATPANGSAPLAMEFRGVVTGGTETYTGLVWQFGDGTYGNGTVVSHTYETAGRYNVTLTATDSAGDSGEGTLLIDVGEAASNVGGTSAPAPLWLYGVPIALGAVAFVGVLALRRRTTPGPPPVGVYGGFDEPTHGPEAAPPAALTSSPAPEAGAGAGPGDASPAPPGPRTDPRQVSREVVVFLYRLGRVGPDDLPSSDWTQRGIGERLGVSQNVLSNVVRRLEAAGVVTSRTEHVQGRPRRVKTYYLTAAGERLARGLIRTAPPKEPPSG